MCLLFNIFLSCVYTDKLYYEKQRPSRATSPYIQALCQWLYFQLTDLTLLFLLLSAPSRSPPRLLPFSYSLLSLPFLQWHKLP